MATLEYVKKTETSITGIVTGLSPYSYKRTVYLDAYLGNNKVASKSKELAANPSSTIDSGNITVSGLSPGTTYRIECFIYLHGSGENVYIGNFTKTTDAETPVITQWSWHSVNSTNTQIVYHPAETPSATITRKAETAVKGNGKTTDFEYTVWNDLVYKVYEARLAYGSSSWNTRYASLQDTLMTSSSKVLTAQRYNSMRYNLGEKYSTGIGEVTSGVTKVNGTTHFVNFVNKLNEFIDEINSA